MNIIELLPFSAAEFYLGFFGVSVCILALIVLSGVPASYRKLGHAVRLCQARRARSVRMLASQELLDAAGASLEGEIINAEATFQVVEDASEFTSRTA